MLLFKSRLFKILFETFFSNSGDSSGAEINIDINGSIVDWTYSKSIEL